MGKYSIMKKKRTRRLAELKNIFPTTYMMLDARHCPKRRGLFFELLIFYFAYWIIKMIESVVAAIPQTFYLLRDPDFLSLLADPDQLETMTVEQFAEFFLSLTQKMPSSLLLCTLFATVVTVLGAIFVCVKLEKRNLSSMGLRGRGAVGEYLLGLGFGAVLLGGAVLIAHGTGAMDFSLNEEANYGTVALFFLAFMVQALSEELLCRGYLMMSLSRTASPMASVILSAVVFAMLHSGNAAVSPLALLNIVLVGILFGAYALKRGSIWGAAAMHAMWNFLQGNVFGIPVSGTPIRDSVLQISSLLDTKHHVSGGAFGLEGGLAVTIVLLIAIGLVFPWKAKASEVVSVQMEEESV